VESAATDKLLERRQQRKGGIQEKIAARAIVIVFYTYLIVQYVRPQDTFPVLGLIRPGLICVVVLAIFSLTRLDSDVFKDRSVRLFIAFVGLCWFGVFHAVNTYHAYQSATVMTAYLVAAVIPMALIIRSESQLRNLAFFWVAAHCYLAVYGLLHNGRGPGSFLGDENDLALALNAALPYAFLLRRDPNFSRFKRLAFLMIAVVITAGVVATNSRGGFVGLAVTTAALVWFSKERVRNALLIFVGATCFYFVIPDDYRAEIQSISDTQDQTRTGRIYHWNRAWEMFLDNPIVGVGPNNYPWRVVEYELQSDDYDPGGRLHGGRVAHSLYFTLLPEHGAVGTAIFFLILWEIVKKLKRVSSRRKSGTDARHETVAELFSRATLVSLIAFLTTGVFISVLYYPVYWYIIGFAFCASLVDDKEQRIGREENAI
jgi:probable O-glycosylation ligase (exosortase A-associated)